jgi:hypothetical protein
MGQDAWVHGVCQLRTRTPRRLVTVRKEWRYRLVGRRCGRAQALRVIAQRQQVREVLLVQSQQISRRAPKPQPGRSDRFFVALCGSGQQSRRSVGYGQSAGTHAPSRIASPESAETSNYPTVASRDAAFARGWHALCCAPFRARQRARRKPKLLLRTYS